MARPIAGHIILSKVSLLREWLLEFFTLFLVRQVIYDVRDRKDITPITLPGRPVGFSDSNGKRTRPPGARRVKHCVNILVYICKTVTAVTVSSTEATEDISASDLCSGGCLHEETPRGRYAYIWKRTFASSAS